MMRFIALFLLLFAINSFAQENLTYQKPSKEILDLVDVPLAPSVFVDDKREFMVFAYRDAYKTMAELSQEELRLGGLRIDPKTNIGSRVTYFNNLKIKNLNDKDSKIIQVRGLPENPRLANFNYSQDQKKMAMTHTIANGVEVWVLDVADASVLKLTEARVNANMRDVFNWFEDGSALLVKMISGKRQNLIDAEKAVPAGPTVSISEGKKAQNRTYQDLFKNPNDEHNFEQLALSEIYKISLDGKKEKWLGSAMYGDINFSPDGNYVLVNTVERPFSYLVPYYRFPSKLIVYTKDAQMVETIVEVPLIENLPKGFMAARQGRRNISWRNDKPATLVYAEALDGGDPENKVEYRDEVFLLEAPFNGAPKSILKTVNRFGGVEWGNDKVAIAGDYWWNTRNQDIDI